jgi:2-methylisocitrate lyase-like PEP mutase family enzyme
LSALHGQNAGPMEAGRPARLRGVFCAGIEQAAAASRAGTDFLVMSNALADAELASLCAAVAVPVFARAIGLEQAWALGASGLNEIEARLESGPQVLLEES